MYNQVELIIKKREGLTLERKELKYLIEGFIADNIPDYQMAALLMAIYFQGMSDPEVLTLTETYINSGKTISFPQDWHTVDKHSTGGVGDKISLMLAPIVAACGALIPMISGRGLGHTGGTLDKLEAIPGLSTDFSETEFRQIIERVGFSIISQSQELVPADRQIYALRDVTATVESLPLITASIISKKVAEGAQNLVIDLKVGSGAFIKELEKAKELGRLLKQTSQNLGQNTEIVYSDMTNPLGFFIGNALEIRETIEYLKGANIPDIDLLTRTLAKKMLVLANKAESEEKAAEMVEQAISSGKALECFSKFIEAQGGDPRICDDSSLLPQSRLTLPIKAERSGWISDINSQAIGYALIDIGAGRKKLDSKLDYATGAYLTPKIGDYVAKGEEIGKLFCQREEELIMTKIVEAYSFSEEKEERRKLIL